MSIRFRSKTIPGFVVDAPFEQFWFPGGEAHIKITETKQVFQYQIADLRGAEPQDLFMLSMWGQVVASRGERAVVLLPYLPAARADRGVPNLKSYVNIVADALADQIIYLDPHSPEWIKQYKNVDDEAILTEFPFERIIKNVLQDRASDSKAQPYVGVIAPDHGAVDRATRAANVMGVPVYKAGKTRDFETGKLTGFHMEDELPAAGKFLIVDDICDGGGTFNGLAESIGIGKDRLDLWVTHGIFSKGIDTLLENFGTIHTTDSWDASLKTKRKGAFTVHPVLPYLTEAITL